ncbi:MAG: preprotein translocase subunit SecG [Candidatus Eisenbacteria bacterium]|nr:preprotein translocase subunit SecG [Candidatus Eisenbacteria bacterium]
MAGVLLGLHILISFALVVVVLLQSGKGGGLAGAFGGAGGVGAVFGGQTAADFLTKATRYLAVAFFLTSLVLAIVSRERVLGTVEGSLERRASTPAAQPVEQLPPGEVPEGLPGGPGDSPGTAGEPPGAEGELPPAPEGGLGREAGEEPE